MKLCHAWGVCLYEQAYWARLLCLVHMTSAGHVAAYLGVILHLVRLQ